MQTSRESRDALLDRVARKAGDYEEASVNCAQGTLLALVEEFRLSEGKDVLKAAYFTPGIIARGETCGAVIGGLMAFGLAFGRDTLEAAEIDNPKEAENFFKIRNYVWRFCENFKQEYGSILCKDIRKQIMGKSYNSMDPAERQQFIEDDGPRKCRVPPEKAAKIAAAIFLDIFQERDQPEDVV